MHNGEEEFSLFMVLPTLLKYWWVVAALTAASLVVGVVLSELRPTAYQASAMLSVRSDLLPPAVVAEIVKLQHGGDVRAEVVKNTSLISITLTTTREDEAQTHLERVLQDAAREAQKILPDYRMRKDLLLQQAEVLLALTHIEGEEPLSTISFIETQMTMTAIASLLSRAYTEEQREEEKETLIAVLSPSSESTALPTHDPKVLAICVLLGLFIGGATIYLLEGYQRYQKSKIKEAEF